MSALTIQEIKEIIPHRYPMLLVDRVEELEEGKRVVAKKNVTINEPFFQGHFPHEPVMPGVLIVEAMAQAGAVALLSLEDFRWENCLLWRFRQSEIQKKSNTRRYLDLRSRNNQSEICSRHRQRNCLC